MAKRKINVGAIAGGVFTIALVGLVGYIILRRDEIIHGLDRRLNLSGGTSGIGGTGNEGYPTGDDVDTSQTVNNDNDSSVPNDNNLDRSTTFSPRKSSQHNTNAKIYQQQQQQQPQQLQYSAPNPAGYDLSVRVSPRPTQQQQINQYLANRQGFDRASTFQSDPGSLPKPTRDASGKAVVNTAVPSALKHLFSSNTRVVGSTTKHTKTANLYAGLSGGHTGFRGAGR